ncbi:hypothetical protein DFH09DRAFT_1097877 [Mycena vulgaris]|nr:hypothetical protein DFH09DRAFT_1097877 [Mycena vulgaris]
MSLSGISYYDKELKHLVCLLKALPESEKPTISRISNYVTPSITPECQAGEKIFFSVPPDKEITSDVCRGWTGATLLNAVDDDEDDSPPAGAVSQTTLNVLRDGVDIRLPFFRDLLADKPIEGADAIQSLADWSEDVVGGVRGHRKAAGKKAWDGEAIWGKMNYKQDPISDHAEAKLRVGIWGEKWKQAEKWWGKGKEQSDTSQHAHFSHSFASISGISKAG